MSWIPRQYDCEILFLGGGGGAGAITTDKRAIYSAAAAGRKEYDARNGTQLRPRWCVVMNGLGFGV